MTEVSIVVEGPFDAKLLKIYLPKLEGLVMRFYASNGKTSLATMARNLLVHTSSKVLVVMDADTLDIEETEQRRLMTLAALRQIAAEERFDVFAFRPEHEVIFFEAPEVLKRHISPRKKGLSSVSLRHGLYTHAPRKELERLLMEFKHAHLFLWLSMLSPEDGNILRKGVQASHLVAMFERLMAERLEEV